MKHGISLCGRIADLLAEKFPHPALEHEKFFAYMFNQTVYMA
jgi:hypothetical protein